MLEQTHGLLLHKLGDHVTKHGAHGIEALVCLTNVCQTGIIQKDLLDNEDGHGLGQLRAGFHDAQTEGDDFGGEQEVNDFRRVIFNESADDAQGSEAQVFVWAGFGGGVEEGIEKEGNMRWDC